jgi:hypothetical protein
MIVLGCTLASLATVGVLWLSAVLSPAPAPSAAAPAPPTPVGAAAPVPPLPAAQAEPVLTELGNIVKQ